MARRSFATMPFLATVIADEKVAAAYHNKKFQCTIIYLNKSRSFIKLYIISHVLEFAKRFWSDEGIYLRCLLRCSGLWLTLRYYVEKTAILSKIRDAVLCLCL